MNKDIRIMKTPKGTEYKVNNSYMAMLFADKNTSLERIMFINYVDDLQKYCEDLQRRIDKSNKKLKNWDALELDDLLKVIRDIEKILKGENNE